MYKNVSFWVIVRTTLHSSMVREMEKVCGQTTKVWLCLICQVMSLEYPIVWMFVVLNKKENTMPWFCWNQQINGFVTRALSHFHANVSSRINPQDLQLYNLPHSIYAYFCHLIYISCIYSIHRNSKLHEESILFFLSVVMSNIEYSSKHYASLFYQ